MATRAATSPSNLPAEEPGVHFWAVRRDQCRWPLTAVSPLSSFRFCGAKVVRRCWCAAHADQALQPHPNAFPLRREKRSAPPQPTLASDPPAIEQAPVTARSCGCRCRDRSVLALERWGIEPDEARDIVTRMFAAFRPSERVVMWLAIEPRFREIARRRLGTHGAAPGRPARPDSAGGRVRDLAAALMGVSSRTAGRMLAIGRAALDDPARFGELLTDMDHNGAGGA
jgi:hypothetical protein